VLLILDRLERLLAIAACEGISVRCEWMGGIRGGLARVGRKPVLFVDESLSVPDQFDQVRNALKQLDWTETDWSEEMNALLEINALERKENQVMG